MKKAEKKGEEKINEEGVMKGQPFFFFF